ncbi:hypothetical protein FB451DRAFT_245081 [Mycena latifolia]|nr:hypothetical protein FB451DRAFT_245081 [Mycena latifolia]
MSFFKNCTDLHFDGGNFYNVAGHVHLQANQLSVHDRPAVEEPPRFARGGLVRRHPRDATAARAIPYPSSSRTRNSSEHSHLRDHRDTIRQRSSGAGSYVHPLRTSPMASLVPLYHGSISNPSKDTTEDLSNLYYDNACNYTPSEAAKIPRGGGTYITTGTVNHIQRNYETAGIHLLHRSVALEALYDSAEGFPQPRIHPGTRQKLLNELWDMATEPLASSMSGSEIVWVHGPAGAGKSAVMQTLCKQLQQAGRLGGSFFFKRDHPIRASAKALFATLAYQLALYIPDLKIGISQKVEEDPSVIGRCIGVQLKQLIVEPCLSLKAWTHPVIIAIDGLDECEGQDVQEEILRVLDESFREDHPPIRIFIASRPEPHIREALQACGRWTSHVDVKQSFTDVRNYLQTEFARISSEHETMNAVSGSWPTSEALRQLVSNSSGFFIYPTMIIKFVDDRNFRPQQQLQRVHKMRGHKSLAQARTPLHALDSVYTQILAGITPQPQLLTILAAILSFNVLSITHLEQVLKLRPGDIRLALRGLHAVLDVPPKSDPRSRIGVHHASFLDFLDDPTRAGQFYVGGPEHLLAIARGILRALSSVSPVGHVAWSQALRMNGISYITSKIPPSQGVDLISLLQQINPDFLFYDGSSKVIQNTTSNIVKWLKKIQPEPKNLLQFWNGYMSEEELRTTIPDSPMPISLCISDWSSSGDLARCCLHIMRFIGTATPPLHFW